MAESTAWHGLVVLVVAGFTGISIIESVALRFGDTELTLSDEFAKWRKASLNDIRAEKAAKEQGQTLDLARRLERQVPRGELENEVRRIAASLEGVSGEDEIERIRGLPEADQIYELSYWIASDDPVTGRRLLELHDGAE